MTGTIIQFWSDVVEIGFHNNQIPALNSLLTMHNNQTYLQVKRLVNDHTVRAIIVYAAAPIQIGDLTSQVSAGFLVPVGKKSCNNIYGFDGVPLIPVNKNEIRYVSLNSTINANRVLNSQLQLLETGIKAIDFFMPIIQGYKLGIFGGAGVGKTVLMKEIIFNVNKYQQKTTNIFIGSGERSREAVELYNELVQSKLMASSVMYISKMNESAGARTAIVPIGVTAAEYMRDVEKTNVLLFVDNIYRFIQAQNEVAAALGKKPSVGGYQATLDSDVAHVQDRLFKNENGSITSFQTIFLPMDDLSDPSAVAVFNHLDGSLVLSRAQSAKNLFPAFDPLASSSNSVDPDIIGQEHFDAIYEVKRILKAYKDLEDVILIFGYDDLDEENQKLVKKALQLENFFTQNFFMTEHFTNEPGTYVPLKDTVASVQRILNGEFLNQSPEIFSYIGDNLSLPSDVDLGLVKVNQEKGA